MSVRQKDGFHFQPFRLDMTHQIRRAGGRINDHRLLCFFINRKITICTDDSCYKFSTFIFLTCRPFNIDHAVQLLNLLADFFKLFSSMYDKSNLNGRCPLLARTYIH